MRSKLGKCCASGDYVDFSVNTNPPGRGARVCGGRDRGSVYERARRMDLDAPIMAAVYQMLHEGKPPLAAVQELMTRRPKDERFG